MQFSHKQQIEHLEEKFREANSQLERTMINDILVSVLECKGHYVISGGMVHLTMSYNRYKKFMVDVVTPERDLIFPPGNDAIIE